MVANSLEERVLKFIRAMPEGCSTQMLIDQLVTSDDTVTQKLIQDAVNKLLTIHRITMYTVGEDVIIKEVSKEAAAKIKGLAAEDILIFELIKGAGSTGIWTRDMRTRTNLQTAQVTRILKTLESRKLVKSVRSVANGNKKVYMLYDKEPSKDITGGAWYTEAEFDTEFIKILREACLRLIRMEGQVTLDQVRDFVAARKLSKVELRSEDVFQILNTLVLDNAIEIVEDIVDEEEVEYFRVSKARAPMSISLTSIPCGVCPVIHDCTPGGVISPETCEYYQEYLKF